MLDYIATYLRRHTDLVTTMTITLLLGKDLNPVIATS